MAELLSAPGALGTFLVAVIIFGFAPGMVLAVVVRLIPDPDRRRELQAELYEVPRWERPFWVAQQVECALRLGLSPRISWWWGRYVWHRCTIESGLKRHLEYPSFWVPEDEIKELIAPGDIVKLVWAVKRYPGERMWVQVIDRDGDRLVGLLDNWPAFVHLSPGDVVKFHIDDIIDFEFMDDEVGGTTPVGVQDAQ